MKYVFDPFYFEYEKIDFPVSDFKTECVVAARKANASNFKNLPIVVMMSGGVDSQIIAESFLLAKIPFKCLIGVLNIDVADSSIILNDHDYSFAEKWCEKNNIEIVKCGIDVFKDAKTLTEFSLFSKGFSPQYACHMFLMKWANDNGYFFVAGLGDIDIRLLDGEYFCCDTQREWSIDIFCEKHKLNGVIRFCKQDSRMTAAFLNLNSVRTLMDNREPFLLDHKYHYFAEVFEIEERPKLTGFEKIQEWDSILRGYMKKKNGKYDSLNKIPISFFKC